MCVSCHGRRAVGSPATGLCLLVDGHEEIVVARRILTSNLGQLSMDFRTGRSTGNHGNLMWVFHTAMFITHFPGNGLHMFIPTIYGDLGNCFVNYDCYNYPHYCFLMHVLKIKCGVLPQVFHQTILGLSLLKVCRRV